MILNLFKRFGLFLKRISKRAYVRYVAFNRRNNSGEQVSATQKMSMSIARSLINHLDSKFSIAPKSGKRYVKNETKGIFIVLDKGAFSITNHVYHYDVVVSDRNWERITRMFDDKVETIRQEYENQIMSRIEHSLKQICDIVRSN